MSPGAPVRVAIADYGAGNLVSIRNALVRLGAEVHVATGADGLREADLIVVPGVGASAPAMARLRRRGLAEAIPAAIRTGTWYLGVCLGMQLLFDRSEEDGARMLGILPGEVRRLTGAPRLPHIGWNQLEAVRPDPVLTGLPDRAPAYFVHSYAPVPADAAVIVTRTVHGDPFTSLVTSGRILGCQFHPERSGTDGLRILRNVLALVAADGGR